MSSIESDRSLEKVTTGDFAGGGLLNRQQFNEFFREVQNTTELLDRVRFEDVDHPKGQIDKIGVGERLLRAATEAQSGTLQAPSTGSLNYDTEKVELPWEVSMETVEDTIEGEGTADTLVDLFSQQFGVDVEDLGINGDASLVDAFLGIQDGWLTTATARGAPTYDHAGAAIDKSVFKQVAGLLSEKYKRDQGLTFIMSQAQLDEFKDYLTDRSTGAGDQMLLSGDEPTPYGYGVVTPPAWPDDTIMFTNPQNLIFIAQREMMMRRTTEGEAVVRRDLYAIYNLLARIDYQIEDENAVALGINIAAP